MCKTLPAISINGTLYSRENANVSVFDHGFLYGDGVFEGIRIYGGKIFRADRHVTRLFRSAKVLDLPIGWTREEIVEEIRKTAREWAAINGVDVRNNDDPLYVRVVVSRGDGDLGLDPRKCPKPNVVVIVDRIKLYAKEQYENGLALVTTAIRRNLPDTLPPQVKSLNYLSNVLAKLDANRENAAEAIFFNTQGYVAEATADNLFIVSNGEVVTPPISDGALPGITREAVLELAAELSIPRREWHITMPDLFCADECFLTGTAARVVPVTAINARTIGNGRPGPITHRLMEAFVDLTCRDGVCIYDK
ncbi:MAG: branched-chain-amino-acid transaminase [Candidatus Omnitrophota bacterium]|nr:MAG: branched-chain-amino-acid transaminase [Candidatus Omnitrophota bacterium]